MFDVLHMCACAPYFYGERKGWARCIDTRRTLFQFAWFPFLAGKCCLGYCSPSEVIRNVFMAAESIWTASFNFRILTGNSIWIETTSNITHIITRWYIANDKTDVVYCIPKIVCAIFVSSIGWPFVVLSFNPEWYVVIEIFAWRGFGMTIDMDI